MIVLELRSGQLKIVMNNKILSIIVLVITWDGYKLIV